MTNTELTSMGAARLALHLQSRSISAQALVRACLARIEERENELHAWSHVAADAALQRAKALDAGPICGPLHGLPLGIKDIFDTFDMPTTYGSPIYSRHQPEADAATVALTRAAGAVLLGKTVTTEFATFQAGPTRNPVNPAFTPGGSSSGSCAAVGAGMVPLAFGSQTAASIIRPAAYCGVVGYKPSFGMITRAGVKGLADSLDTVGCVGTEVADVALLAGVLSGDSSLWRLDAEAIPRVGLCRTPDWDSVAAETRQAWVKAETVLARANVHMIDIDLPAIFAELNQAHLDIMAYEAARSLADERLRHYALLSTPLQELVSRGLSIKFDHYRAQRAKASRARSTLPDIFKSVDVLLAPSASGEAPRFEDGTGDPRYCRGWTLLGMPCVHLPFTRSPQQGLPVGLQAVGLPGSDRQTLACAAWLLKHLREC